MKCFGMCFAGSLFCCIGSTNVPEDIVFQEQSGSDVLHYAVDYVLALARGRVIENSLSGIRGYRHIQGRVRMWSHPRLS